MPFSIVLRPKRRRQYSSRTRSEWARKPKVIQSTLTSNDPLYFASSYCIGCDCEQISLLCSFSFVMEKNGNLFQILNDKLTRAINYIFHMLFVQYSASNMCVSFFPLSAKQYVKFV